MSFRTLNSRFAASLATRFNHLRKNDLRTIRRIPKIRLKIGKLVQMAAVLKIAFCRCDEEDISLQGAKAQRRNANSEFEFFAPLRLCVSPIFNFRAPQTAQLPKLPPRKKNIFFDDRTRMHFQQ